MEKNGRIKLGEHYRESPWGEVKRACVQAKQQKRSHGKATGAERSKNKEVTDADHCAIRCGQ